MKPVSKDIMTIEDFRKYPEGTTAELIDGNIFDLPRRTYIHQIVLMDIQFGIADKIESNQISGKIINWVDVYLDKETIVQPDLIFIKNDNLNIISDYIHGVPDMLIEIIMPEGFSHDFITKYNLYAAYGVQEYFVINPEDKLVICYRLVNKKYMEAYRDVGILKSTVMNAEFTF